MVCLGAVSRNRPQDNARHSGADGRLTLSAPFCNPHFPEAFPHMTEADLTPKAPLVREDEHPQFERTMKARHLIMLSLGGVIGTGLSSTRAS